jgi:hypothetical protein
MTLSLLGATGICRQRGHAPSLLASPTLGSERQLRRPQGSNREHSAAIIPARTGWLSWQSEYWGENYPRLRAIKNKYDPDGLFFVHHGVGSEDWSADGFTRVT